MHLFLFTEAFLLYLASAETEKWDDKSLLFIEDVSTLPISARMLLYVLNHIGIWCFLLVQMFLMSGFVYENMCWKQFSSFYFLLFRHLHSHQDEHKK